MPLITKRVQVFLLLKPGFEIDALRRPGSSGAHSWPFNETLLVLCAAAGCITGKDKAMGILIGSYTDDTGWYWVRDKVWTCKLAEGPLLPPPLANSLSPFAVSSVSRAGLDSPGRSTKAAIRHLSDSHPQQSSLKGKPLVHILRDTGIPPPLFYTVFCFANSLLLLTRSGSFMPLFGNIHIYLKNDTCVSMIHNHEQVLSSKRVYCKWFPR